MIKGAYTIFSNYNRGFLILAILIFYHPTFAQKGKILEGVKDRIGGLSQGRSGSTDSSGGDFQHRNDLADSITISYRYLDSLKSGRLDSSLNDFHKFFSVPANYVTLGNNGSPGYPILFTPILKPGWDAGFHAYDAYKFTLEGSRFFKTTRPYTLITYLLATGKEQLIKVLHTQNIKPNWNFGFEYKLISSPGFFITQNTNHNSYRLFSNYQGNKKRYAAYFLLFGNKLSASENGGIRSDTFLANPKYARRFTIPVNLGGDATAAINVFSTKVSTGNVYQDFTFFFRQSYDFGKRDSIEINDSTKEFLFYPKLRFQHTINYSSSGYTFKDTLTGISDARLDSALFKKWYDTTLHPSASGLNFLLSDKWKSVSNDFSIRQFPETKNPAQFIDVGLKLENFTGTFTTIKKNFYNVVLHAEYRNKTKNKKWDAIAKGEFYPTGLNAGDYNAYITLTRFLNPKLGDVQISFQNVNRSPSYIFNDNSSFNFKDHLAAKKENITVLTGTAENPKFTLWVRNISITNFSHFKGYYQKAQAGLVNITQVQSYKLSAISKHLKLYSDVILQQVAGNTPLRVPFFYTRQRLAFEGRFFKNLNLSTGVDINYNTPFKAYNYSPVTGQFFPQDTTSIKNLPQISYFFHFRIKSFTGIIKAENLNAVSFNKGFGFTNTSFAAPHYPIPGLIIRVGVQWAFVN